MIAITAFLHKKVALFGLGGSGLATAQALKAGGAFVEACDDNVEKQALAREKGIATIDLKTADWNSYDAFILSPGVPLTHPEPHWSVEAARKANVEIIGDIELFCRERAHVAPLAPFVAITGTNGKSTTTALTAHILREAGYDVQMGGNIGTAILLLEPFAKNRIYVVECSSFQIDLAPSLKPTVGVLLNLSPDHLDRHGSMEHYACIKECLVQAAQFCVMGDDDAFTKSIAARVKKPMVRISVEHSLTDGLFAKGSEIFMAKGGQESRFADLSGIASLRGAHNAQNACAAIAIARSFEIPNDVIVQALHSFPGLAHRMEQIAQRGTVLFINDSKATNADSTEKALLSFDNIYWILGGKPKAGGIETLIPLFSRVKKAYLIGEAAQGFAETLKGKVPFMDCGTLDNAVQMANEDAQNAGGDGVVLLSPACASYDQYPNFEVRGEHFRARVQGILAKN